MRSVRDADSAAGVRRLRWGEVAALRVNRVDLRRRIEVDEAHTEVKGHVVQGSTKTPQRRSVAIPRFLADELSGHLAPGRPRGSGVHRTRGGVLRNSNFRPRFFDPAAERAGWPGSHRMAAAHGSHPRRPGGANVKVVQQMLGHASAAMTLDVWAGLFSDNLDDVADRLTAFGNLSADPGADQPDRIDRDATAPTSQLPLTRVMVEPPKRVELLTYALRARHSSRLAGDAHLLVEACVVAFSLSEQFPDLPREGPA